MTPLKIYVKFKSEKSIRLSFTTFYRLKPFWIVRPTLTDRNTCQCKIHENSQFMATKLKTEKLLPSDNIERICKELVCDYNDKGCMYGKCTTCAKSTADKAVHDKNLLCSWMQWRTIK